MPSSYTNAQHNGWPKMASKVCFKNQNTTEDVPGSASGKPLNSQGVKERRKPALIYG